MFSLLFRRLRMKDSEFEGATASENSLLGPNRSSNLQLSSETASHSLSLSLSSSLPLTLGPFPLPSLLSLSLSPYQICFPFCAWSTICYLCFPFIKKIITFISSSFFRSIDIYFIIFIFSLSLPLKLGFICFTLSLYSLSLSFSLNSF